MDQFVRHFFPQFDAPGAAFKLDSSGSSNTYLKAGLSVTYNALLQNRNYTMNQAMTGLGRSAISIVGAPNCLDGLTRNYVTPEGIMNLDTLGNTLKTRAGVATQQWSAHMGLIQNWAWVDNHVGLLYNMLRFVMLRRMTASRPVDNLDASLGRYADGHVEIDMDQYFGNDYPAENAWEWPGGTADANYPEYVHIATALPADEAEVLDLRGLTLHEAQFVLLMLGAWRRRSRFRLDAASAKLAEVVGYRYPQAIASLDACFDDTPAADKVAMPELPSHITAWAALRKYVNYNRLYDQFSTALYILCCTAYQYKPTTAEGVWWMSVDWTVQLPIFRSVRGRYTILNEGDPAYLGHRGHGEWGFINNKLEKVNLMALVFAQAVFAGFGLRAIKQGLEDDPRDIFTTSGEFYQPFRVMAAAASESTRIPAPQSAMSDVMVYCTERFDDFDEERHVVTLRSAALAKPAGYQWRTRSEAVTVTMVLPPRPAAEPSAVGAAPPAPTTHQVVQQRAVIVLPWVPLPGVPTLLLPLNPLPRPTPLSLSGVIDKDKGIAGRRGWSTDWYLAWEFANLARLAGYDIRIRDDKSFAGPDRYFAPNDANMVWPLLRFDEGQTDFALINDMVQRANNWIALPSIHTKLFTGQVDYKSTVTARGTAQAPHDAETDIREYGGSFSAQGQTSVAYSVPAGVAMVRGYVQRTASGFHFAEDAQVGEIPASTETHDAFGA